VMEHWNCREKLSFEGRRNSVILDSIGFGGYKLAKVYQFNIKVSQKLNHYLFAQPIPNFM